MSIAPVSQPPVIFLAFASVAVENHHPLPRLAAEAAQLREIFEASELAAKYKLVLLENVTLDQILDTFQRPDLHGRIAVFHFAGHGDSDELLMDRAAGQPLLVNAGALAAFLAEQRGLRLVFLNACRTQAQVAGLLAAEVPAVVATTAEVEDELAAPFAVRFYKGLAGGASIASAFRATRAALQAMYGTLAEPPWQLDTRTKADGEWTLGKNVPPGPRFPLWVGVPAFPPIQPVGRNALLTDWIDRLTAGHPTALAICGLPGVGKTTLALLLAHDERLQRHCTDGVLWARLGLNGSVTAVQASWGEALGIDLSGKADPVQRQELLSRVVGLRKVLVVLDDVWALETALALRFSGPNVVHVITTRSEEIALGFAPEGTVVAPVLDEETGRDLLQQLAPKTCTEDPAAARQLAGRAGGLPLALELLGRYLARPAKFAGQRAQAIEKLADPRERLQLATRRLGDATDAAQSLEAVMRLSVDELERTDSAAAAAFWALGAFAPKPASFDVAAAKAVGNADEDVLARLAEWSLVDVTQVEQVEVHQVVHDVMASGTPTVAKDRYFDFYLQRLAACSSSADLLSVYARIRFAAGFSESVPGGDVGAMMRAVDLHLRATGRQQELLHYVEVVAEHVFTPGQRETLAVWLRDRLTLDVLDNREQGWLCLFLGACLGWLGRLEAAEQAYGEAKNLLGAGELQAQCRICVGLANIAANQQRFDDAAAYLAEARSLAHSWASLAAGSDLEEAAQRLQRQTYVISGQIAADMEDWEMAAQWLATARRQFHHHRARFPGDYARCLEVTSYAHWQRAAAIESDASATIEQTFVEYRQAYEDAKEGLEVLQAGLLNVEALVQAWFNLGDYAAKCSEDPALTPEQRINYENEAAAARDEMNTLCERFNVPIPT